MKQNALWNPFSATVFILLTENRCDVVLLCRPQVVLSPDMSNSNCRSKFEVQMSRLTVIGNENVKIVLGAYLRRK